MRARTEAGGADGGRERGRRQGARTEVGPCRRSPAPSRPAPSSSSCLSLVLALRPRPKRRGDGGRALSTFAPASSFPLARVLSFSVSLLPPSPSRPLPLLPPSLFPPSPLSSVPPALALVLSPSRPRPCPQSLNPSRPLLSSSARTVGSRSKATKASWRATAVARSTALRFSRRFTLTVTTGPARDTSTSGSMSIEEVGRAGCGQGRGCRAPSAAHPPHPLDSLLLLLCTRDDAITSGRSSHRRPRRRLRLRPHPPRRPHLRRPRRRRDRPQTARAAGPAGPRPPGPAAPGKPDPIQSRSVPWFSFRAHGAPSPPSLLRRPPSPSSVALLHRPPPSPSSVALLHRPPPSPSSNPLLRRPAPSPSSIALLRRPPPSPSTILPQRRRRRPRPPTAPATAQTPPAGASRA